MRRDPYMHGKWQKYMSKVRRENIRILRQSMGQAILRQKASFLLNVLLFDSNWLCRKLRWVLV